MQNIQLAPLKWSGRPVDSLRNSWLDPFDMACMLDMVEGPIATIVTPISAGDNSGQANNGGNAGNNARGPHIERFSLSGRLNGCVGETQPRRTRGNKHPKNCLGTGTRQYKASAVPGSDRPASPAGRHLRQREGYSNENPLASGDWGPAPRAAVD